MRDRRDATLVFICLGNICRSPFAEFWMVRRRPDLADHVTSAGFFPGGRNSPDTAVAVAAQTFDLDLSVHVSRGLSEVPDGDRLWVVMEHVHLRRLVRAGIPGDDVLLLGDLDPEPIDRRAILDPYGKSHEVFKARYRRIVRCLEALDEARAD